MDEDGCVMTVKRISPENKLKYPAKQKGKNISNSRYIQRI
jgi:hypothetical protein